MKAHIKERLLQIAKVKIQKTLDKYPDQTAAFLVPIEVKLLLDSGYVKRRNTYGDWPIDAQLSRIPIGDCTPTIVHFYNEESDIEMSKRIEGLSIVAKLKEGVCTKNISI